MSTEVIHIAGRYNKYVRDLSQSPWIDKEDVRIKDSVQELIEDGLKEFIKFDKCTFSSSGREDVDVRMLGRGRPFTFKIQNTQLGPDYIIGTLEKIQNFVNSKNADRISIRDLQIVTKNDVSKYMTESQDSKKKEYCALCCCSRPLKCEDIKKIDDIKDLVIEQVTPIRVLHRRTLAVRKRTICHMQIKPIDLKDNIYSKHPNRVFTLNLTTEAGTYIKEFVHGDFGRTKPDLASLLGGDCETDLIELDVMEVYSDWPPELSNEPHEQASMMSVENDTKHQVSGDKASTSPEELADLYDKALKLMQEAESLSRCERRQELYIQAMYLFKRSMDLVENLDLFSDNETVEDIATVDLKYLLVPAYLAKIRLSSEFGSNRLETLTKAQDLALRFLKRISQYKLGDNRVDQVLEEYNNESIGMSRCAFLHSTSKAELMDTRRLAQKRDETVKKYRKAKELEAKLSELDMRMKKHGQELIDDEVHRDYYMALIEKTVEDTLDNLEKEIELAIYLERNWPNVNHLDPSTSVNLRQESGPPITIVKDHIQKQVFGLGYPSHPTVTVDEFIKKKISDGDLVFDKHEKIYANSLQRYAEQPNLRREQEDMSDRESDVKEDRHDEVELQRKREWDEFKDANPRGSGNRHNMG